MNQSVVERPASVSVREERHGAIALRTADGAHAHLVGHCMSSPADAARTGT